MAFVLPVSAYVTGLSVNCWVNRIEIPHAARGDLTSTISQFWADSYEVASMCYTLILHTDSHYRHCFQGDDKSSKNSAVQGSDLSDHGQCERDCNRDSRDGYWKTV